MSISEVPETVSLVSAGRFSSDVRDINSGDLHKKCASPISANIMNKSLPCLSLVFNEGDVVLQTVHITWWTGRQAGWLDFLLALFRTTRAVFSVIYLYSVHFWQKFFLFLMTYQTLHCEGVRRETRRGSW